MSNKLEAALHGSDPKADLAALSRWVDDSLDGRGAEAILLHRVIKLVEEAGETVGALIGATGANPRKGFTHSLREVQLELLDVAISALGAVEHLGGNRGTSLDLLEERIVFVAARAGVHRD